MPSGFATHSWVSLGQHCAVPHFELNNLCFTQQHVVSGAHWSACVASQFGAELRGAMGDAAAAAIARAKRSKMAVFDIGQRESWEHVSFMRRFRKRGSVGSVEVDPTHRSEVTLAPRAAQHVTGRETVKKSVT